MKKEKFIHNVLKKIDWDFVLFCYKKLNLGGNEIKKTDLINNL